MNAQTSNFTSQPAFALDAKLTPGLYMRQCRKAAGKTIDDCVGAIALAQHDRLFARHDLVSLERDKPGDYSLLIHHLRQREAFPFDLATFAALAAATSDVSLGEWDDV